ncbi:Zinc-binding dehydrogenase [Streptoalloteichus tenebrarius]|uniref:Zinc-binding dehydrogenase n=1 Tax=Streptoalloteichus tenebrarius (strain ATCC 17920 / DSM 40477 / JCM 4838 / CBS 697.72 / NBRC 16177 / NCIMB 11028 / NRRL B-12390 / A12253. 1 / ISP 5477) TaxID=1933 RepID=A0ABT1I1F4_STRSD|nr:zinc-binding dehydrogenase [Streptoalloteichus tenebrarius]MCP2261618.1 Zinc-binding dehydrogenase [Streptoalloteichus tenebrarius]BFE99381.1 hypothetical protein GCM10020241_10570 [Streptoalloteichus tenebrarius]
MRALLPAEQSTGQNTEQFTDRPAVPAALVVEAEIPAPEPSSDQALVKVEAFSLNRTDLLYLTSARELRPQSRLASRRRPRGHRRARGGRRQRTSGRGTRRTAVRATGVADRGHGRGRALRGGLAASAGAELTAVAAPHEPWQRLPELGAVAVIHDVADAERPFDVVLESIGGAHLSTAVSRARRDGLVLWFGQASGQPVTLDFFDYVAGFESVSLRRFTVYDSAASWGADLAALVRLTAAGRLRPQIDHRRPWTEVGDALALLAGRRLRGKAVFHLGN